VKVGSPSLIHIELCASRHLRQFAVYSRRYAQAPDFRAASLQIRRARAGELGNQLSLTPYSGSLAVATRLLECCQLRVQDVDFAANQIVVRSGKDDKDGVTMLPGLVKSALARHLEIVREQHRRDLQDGAGWVELPMALMRKYPNAGREWAWQWVFPATRMYVDRATRQKRRHHLHGDRAPASGEGRGSKGRYCESGLLRTPSVIPSRHICSKTATTSVPFKNCWVTATSRRRRSIPTY
jgi:hypothetical protein